MKYLNKPHKFPNTKYLEAATYSISHVLITVIPFITTPQTLFFLETCKTGICALKMWGDFSIFRFLLDFGRTPLVASATRVAKIVTFTNMASTNTNSETIDISYNILFEKSFYYSCSYVSEPKSFSGSYLEFATQEMPFSSIDMYTLKDHNEVQQRNTCERKPGSDTQPRKAASCC